MKIKWNPICIVRKYDNDGNFIEEVRSEGNILTTAGMARLVALVASEPAGSPPVNLNEDSVRIGVGDDDTPAEATDTSLGTNEWYQVLESGYPETDGSTISFHVVFGVDDGNFTWSSWGIDVDDTETVVSGDTANELFNRKVFQFGTKDGGIWDVTVAVNFASA